MTQKISSSTEPGAIAGAEAAGPGLQAEAVRAQLERVLESHAFDAPERNRRFLRYVVAEALAGRSDRIKAYSIATAVFGRDKSFDSQTDPIIRIEAGRLRRSLHHYYLTDGRDDPIRIEIPKGSYVPTFEHRPKGDGPAAPEATEPFRRLWPSPGLAWALGGCAVAAAGWLAIAWVYALPPFSGIPVPIVAQRGPAILVRPFEDDGAAGANANLAGGFTREVIAGLTRFKDVFVYGAETSFAYAGGGDPARAAVRPAADFVLSGAVAAPPGRFRAVVALSDAKTGRHLWSERFDAALSAADILGVRERIADRVVRTLAQPYGVMFSEQARAIEGRPPKSFTSYECVLHYYQYQRRLSVAAYDSVRACLDRTVASEPDYAEAFASLAMVYVDAYRFGFGKDTLAFPPLERAMELARRAVDLAPESASGHKALHNALWLRNEVGASMAAAERALTLNPNDAEAMANLGFRLVMLAERTRGVALVKESYARNPAQSSVYRTALFLDAYMDRRYVEALDEAKKIETASIVYPQLMLAIAYAQLGRRHEAAAALALALRLDPTYGERAVGDFTKRNIHPEIVRELVVGLRKAGLDVKEPASGPSR